MCSGEAAQAGLQIVGTVLNFDGQRSATNQAIDAEQQNQIAREQAAARQADQLNKQQAQEANQRSLQAQQQKAAIIAAAAAAGIGGGSVTDQISASDAAAATDLATIEANRRMQQESIQQGIIDSRRTSNSTLGAIRSKGPSLTNAALQIAGAGVQYKTASYNSKVEKAKLDKLGITIPS